MKLKTLIRNVVYEKCIKSLYGMSWNVSKLKSNLSSIVAQDLLEHVQIATSDVGSNPTPETNETPINKYIAWQSDLNSNKRKLMDTLHTRKDKIAKIERFVDEKELMEEEISTAVTKQKDEHEKQTASFPKKDRIKNKRSTALKDSIYLADNAREPVRYPTHCLVIRITNKNVHKKVADLKTDIESMNPNFAPCFVTIPTLHIPLVVMTLNNQTDIQQVYDALELSLVEITKLTSIASNISIEFNALGNFQGKVVFLNIKKNEGLNYFKKVRKLLSNSLCNLNVNVKQEQFKRGVAIMKLSNCFPLMNERGIKNIPTDIYEVHKDDYFGEQELNEILLCSMPSRKKSDSSYDILASMNLMEAKLYLTDREMCNETKGDQVHLPSQMEIEEIIIDGCDNKIVVEKYEDSINEKIHCGDCDTKVYQTDGKNIDEMKKMSKSSKEKKKKEKSKHLSCDRTSSSKQYEDSKTNNFKSKKTLGKSISRSRPTHFLAFRLRNHIIHEKAAELQEAIVNINEDFKCSFVKVPTLHITLAVMALNNEEEIDMAIKALDLSLNRLNDVYNKALCKFIEFDSLGTFREQVLFIDVKNTEGLELLKSIVPILKDSLLQQNIVIQRETFTPHVTVMKLSKCFSLLKKKGIKKIPAGLYEAYKNDYFGKEELIEILLCSMSGKKHDGFYKILASINLKNYKLARFDDKKTLNSKSSLQNVITEQRQSIEYRANELKIHEGQECNEIRESNGLDKSAGAHKQNECSEDTVITIFPEESEDSWEIIDPNYPNYLYGNIFVRLFFRVYTFLLEYYLKVGTALRLNK